MRIFTMLLLVLSGFLQAQNYTIVLHGGAGNGIKPDNFPEERQQEYYQKMEEALQAGAQVLDENGSAEEAVVAVITILENSPLFNAGKGAVFTWDETNEMDASIMRGKDLAAGAVAGVSHIRNPITAALAVMNHSPHVLLSGAGAEQFAFSNGVDSVATDYFKTQKRLDYLLRVKNKKQGSLNSDWEASKMGTVGCAVLDKNGNLAAGTSTGGMTAKRYGRIGDSPIIGAGTYANNETCAISCTGHGEYFIRYAVAHDVHSRMKYGGESGPEAAGIIINSVLKEAGGDGGLIGVTHNGEVIMEMNTSGMFRAYLKEGEKPVTLMFQ